MTRHDDKSDFSCQGEGLLSLLFENANFIKADRCNINQLKNNIFEQHQYCFCCVIIFEVLSQRLTDKLVLSWLLFLLLLYIYLFLYAQYCLLLQEQKKNCL